MSEIKITSEKIKKLHDKMESCSEAQEAIRETFPEAFEVEQEDVTEKVVFLPDTRQGNGFYWIGMYMPEAITHFGYIDASRGFGLCSDEEDNFKIEKGKGENGCTYIRILRRGK